MPQVEITTLNPVHVGNGVFLQKNIELIIKNEDGERLAGVIDDRKVLAIIGEENIDKWVAMIDAGESLVNLIKPRKPDFVLDDICRRAILMDADGYNFQSLKEQLRDGLGRPYIPGSTIKGAIRSAIFNREIRKNGKPINKEKVVFKDRKNRNYATAAELEKELFGDGPQKDLFRFLLIGDAPFVGDATIALPMKSLNIVGDGRSVKLDTKTQQLVEAIDAERTSVFNIKLNHQLLEENNLKGKINKYPEWLKDLKTLFQWVNENTLLLINKEIDFWEEYEEHDRVEDYLEQLHELKETTENCSEGSCVLRMGAGVGWSFINGLWVKEESLVSEELYQELVSLTRPQNSRYSQYPFPKTRRVADSQYFELPGFVKLKLI
ncbi:type III-A CRISPR-associated RAMP protein Csm5 [Thermophagus xiamenensis]|uniref:CRISPR system Cms protein Csm5 n=1 Tax=Thermophagus xiamenensis TaxID=385682 RepID=A0A1I1VCR4_9BACT|nr:type III-A CRISPR-associated RAMP protein Csm5 [Thermophagus xiamenensis]SFD80767.1 CRISPR-associated protein, Csm5 family [Thermophagus xiamenensis]